MARTTKPPQFSFDDSLVRLDRRQKPLTQTQRGNYEWTWCQAPLFFLLPDTDAPQETGFTYREDDRLTFLMFGADVPHSAWCIATPEQPTAAVALTRTDVLIRPGTLPPPWVVSVDAGQGTLVESAILGPTAPRVQGFPLEVFNLVQNFPTPPGTGVFFERFFVRCGYQSPLNNGLQGSDPTGPESAPQQGYTPIVLRREDYTLAHYLAGNVITFGTTNYVIVGLWDNYDTTP
jgi:hypothetical protein